MLLVLACTSPPLESMGWQPEPKVETTDTYDDHEYTFITTALSWEQAAADCSTRGAHLVDLADSVEEAWVWALADAAVSNSGWWHGYSDTVVEGSFVWDGGSASTYTNWRGGEPNDFGGLEDCASFADDGAGAWNDKACTTLYPYVCESGCEKSSWYADLDGDGYGDPASVERACEAPVGLIADSSDCDDTNAAIHPAAAESCDAADADEDCDGLADDADESVDPSGLTTYYLDADSDGDGDAAISVQLCELRAGYSTSAGDCDDADSTRSSLVVETADGYDNNCDGVDDIDGDGWETTADCDDSNPAVSPGAVEVCDGADEDCDGVLDDGATCPGISGTYGDHAYVFVLGASTWDAAQATCAGFGYHLVDVFDSAEQAWIWSEAEAANATSSWWHGYNDQSTEGDFVWDGGATSLSTDWRPGEPNDYAGAEDCGAFADDGGGAWNDKDCATVLPFVCEAGCALSPWYADVDGDGFGDPAAVTGSCSAVAGAVLDGTDCNDGDSAVNSLATEVCGAPEGDEDCDGLVDEADDSLDASTCGSSDSGDTAAVDSADTADSGSANADSADSGGSGSDSGTLPDSGGPDTGTGDSTQDSGAPADSGGEGSERDSGPVDTADLTLDSGVPAPEGCGCDASPTVPHALAAVAAVFAICVGRRKRESTG